MCGLCLQQLKTVMQPGEHLRVIVEGGGCSGFQYKFEVATSANEDDKYVAVLVLASVLFCGSTGRWLLF